MQVFVVDAFSTKNFRGNPAAVVLLQQPMTDPVRQSIAAEMNQAETAYLETFQDGDFKSSHSFTLRWFTPLCEAPMCGHATMAAAAVLFTELHNPSDILSFHTLSGVLKVSKADTPSQQSKAVSMKMSLPWAPPTEPLPAVLGPACDSPEGLALRTACVGSLPVAVCGYTARYGCNYLMFCLQGGTRQQLEAIVPDAAGMLAAVTAADVRAVIVTCQGGSDSPYDFLSRFFAPWMGITEDHVTGSAHGVLGPFWAQRLEGGTGVSAAHAAAVVKPMQARQCSSRGGDLQVEIQAAEGQVALTGAAVVVLRGTLDV
mmetsp:Transcript_15220/g.26384  ORF Transcript_15220/g.26384 Transcript_15220/m.26384 type:complete len:315 (-) Transcript_15220:407-1351(-)|eukprot:CAMPEP_0119102504 /NCGR_PEP_ID=MMETSP1180-20130426/1228_1 /TAXON_ID=3052 ORGANISM="Chlamydomonas cf sp, Strain CCMP681" /NCGR_SAMPLE_ID=MMETSP1180 /ASSEMBLY_ACC=CAM_ASM_000741 /LENGTH=314 /DNA_ID=CAMNT_0007086807 /DNA_START=61 /DNA_END=1005 /DNA_ORIENTATION=+